MVSPIEPIEPIERPPSRPSPSFDSVDLGDDQADVGLAARFDRALVRVDRLRDRPAASGAMAVAALCLLVGAWWLGRSPSPPSVELAIPMATAPPAAGGAGSVIDPLAGSSTGRAGPTRTSVAPSTTESPMLVHVAGAVVRPGIVTMSHGDRLIDAIDAAGGPTEAAEIHRLNLAARVVDGMQIRVPETGEAVTHPTGLAPPASGALIGPDGPGGLSVGPIDLNLATDEQLRNLHGIGPALAAAIIGWREEHGPFTSVDQLLDVPGIGPAKLDGLVEQVVV